MGTFKEKNKVLSSDVICLVTLLGYDFTEYVGFQSQKHRFCSYAVDIWKLFAIAFIEDYFLSFLQQGW